MKTKSLCVPVLEDESHYPAAVYAERDVLSGCLQDAKFLDACMSAGVSEHDFSLTDHEKIFRLIRDMRSGGEPVILSLVAEKINDFPLVSSLVDAGTVLVPSHAEHLVCVLKKKRRLRSLAVTAEWLAEEVIKIGADPDQLAQAICQRLGVQV